MNAAPKTNPAFSAQWQGWLVLVIAGAFAAGNAIFLLLASQSNGHEWIKVIASLWIGAIGAQLGLLSTWCVFANIAGWQRALGTIGLMALLVFPFVIGHSISSRSPTTSSIELAGIVLILSIGTTTAQLPLWILKLLFGWRIAREQTPPSVRRGQFSIGHLLGLMFITGSLIVAIQNMIWFVHVPPRYVWTGIAAILLLPGVGILASVVPALLAILRVREPLWVGWGFYSIAAILFLGLFALVAERRLEDAGEVVFGLAGLPFGLSIPLALVRREGFRLLKGWEFESKGMNT